MKAEDEPLYKILLDINIGIPLYRARRFWPQPGGSGREHVHNGSNNPFSLKSSVSPHPNVIIPGQYHVWGARGGPAI